MTLCIYHGNCADGFTAAWVVRRALGDNVEFHAGHYGQEPPDVTGRDVLMVDFSYKRPVLESICDRAQSVTILDHHKTAQEDLDGFDRAKVVFDMDRSGAQIAWDYFFADDPDVRPRIVDYVGDRDLWRFDLPNSRDVAAWLFSHEYDFDTWTKCANDLMARWSEVVEAGKAIERKHHKDIAELLKVTRREMVIGGHRVPVANLPYTMSSDAAGQMAQNAPFAACYFDRPDARVFSLRSRGEGAEDVSAIAAAYGGGGHRNAAGFQMPVGWEGEQTPPKS